MKNTSDAPKIIIKRPDKDEAATASDLIKLESHMVDRAPEFIMNSSYLVALTDSGEVVGVIGALYWKGGVEIISHVVDQNYRSYGIGLLLFNALVKEIRELNAKIPIRLFLCTVNREYYRKLGFEIVEGKEFIDKIKTECQKCKSGPDGPGYYPCPAVAMEYML